MPEATMHENDFAKSGEHDVGGARQVRPMKPITVAEGVQTFSYCQFRAGVFLTNP